VQLKPAGDGKKTKTPSPRRLPAILLMQGKHKNKMREQIRL
jgi:hypothetical protein